MLGYKQRLELAQLRLRESSTVRTHLKAEVERKKLVSLVHQKEAGKLARKKWA